MMVYSDTLSTTLKSTRSNTCAQVFVTDFYLTWVVPMKSKGDAPLALQDFVHDIGMPRHIHTDDAKELMAGGWKKIINEYGIKQTHTEPYSPWQNRAEATIQKLKKSVILMILQTKLPRRLWDYAAVYEAVKQCLHVQASRGWPDISKYLTFPFYKWVYFLDPTAFPEDRCVFGRWLGVAHQVGQAMCYWILTENGQVVAHSTVERVYPDELGTNSFKTDCSRFDAEIRRRIGNLT